MYQSSNTEFPIFFSALTKTELATLIEEVIIKLHPEKSGEGSKAADPDELLTRGEAGKEFKVSVATIDNYRRNGYIVPCRLGGSVRYKRSDLQKAFSGNIFSPYKLPKNGGKA